MTDWNHLQDIESSLSTHLAGKVVAIACCGSIAAIEIHRVARLLVRHGAKVQFFLTKAAAEFVSPVSLGWCTGRPVIRELTARSEHLEYFGENGKADLLLIAPATANTLAKIAMGLDDNLVTTCITTAMGGAIPILCAPGMHAPMMSNPAVLRNLELVQSYGMELLAPVHAEGKQKMMEAEVILAHILRKLGPGDLLGKRVLLSGGPTREFLDPARCLTNPSSGLSACLLAEEAWRRGAEVRLVYGPGKVTPACWLEVTPVESAEEMGEACIEVLDGPFVDVMIGVAAVSDFRPKQRAFHKRPTADGEFSLQLETTPKIIDMVRAKSPETVLIAFKASSQTDDAGLEAEAERYLQTERADMVVANSIATLGHGFDQETNRYLLCRSGVTAQILGPASKSQLAVKLWDSIAADF